MITIRDIQVILTQPNHSPVAIVKVITSEPRASVDRDTDVEKSELVPAAVCETEMGCESERQKDDESEGEQVD